MNAIRVTVFMCQVMTTYTGFSWHNIKRKIYFARCQEFVTCYCHSINLLYSFVNLTFFSDCVCLCLRLLGSNIDLNSNYLDSRGLGDFCSSQANLDIQCVL